MNIIQNFLSNEQYSFIKDGLMTQTPWEYLNSVVEVPEGIHSILMNDGTEFISSSGFRHRFIWQGEVVSPFSQHMTPLYVKLQELFGDNVSIQNVYAEMLPKTDVKDTWYNYYTIPRIDVTYPQDILDGFDCYTAVYYANTVNCDTMFFAGDNSKVVTPEFVISPEENTMVIWDSDKYHAGPAYVPEQFVTIKFNFIVKK